MRDLIFDEIHSRLKEGEKLSLVLGDLGVFQARKILSEFPHISWNMGILEQSMISFSCGLSSGGYLPIVYSITPFITERVLEQIKLDVSYNSYKIILLSAGGTCDYQDLGPTHHSPCDIALISMYPNIDFFLPFTAKNSQELFKYSIDQAKNSCYIRLKNGNDELVNKYYENKNTARIETLETEIRTSVKVDLFCDIGPDSIFMKGSKSNASLYIKICSSVELKSLFNILKEKDIRIRKLTIRCPFVAPMIIYEECIALASKNVCESIKLLSVKNKYFDRVIDKNEYYEKSIKEEKIN